MLKRIKTVLKFLVMYSKILKKYIIKRFQLKNILEYILVKTADIYLDKFSVYLHFEFLKKKLYGEFKIC